MKEKFTTDTLNVMISTNLNELHATNVSGGRCINEMGVHGIMIKIRCIVVKNPDASCLEIEIFCQCTDRSAARSLQAGSRGSNY